MIHLAVTSLMPNSTTSSTASRPMATDKFMIINFYEDMLSLLFDMQDGIDRHVDMAEVEFLNDKAKRLEHVLSLFNTNTYHREDDDDYDMTCTADDDFKFDSAQQHNDKTRKTEHIPR